MNKKLVGKIRFWNDGRRVYFCNVQNTYYRAERRFGARGYILESRNTSVEIPVLTYFELGETLDYEGVRKD